jgi:hypothetical protein
VDPLGLCGGYSGRTPYTSFDFRGATGFDMVGYVASRAAGQALADTVQSFQDAVIGTFNLLLSIQEDEETSAPQIANPQWAHRLVVSQSELSYNVEKFCLPTALSLGASAVVRAVTAAPSVAGTIEGAAGRAAETVGPGRGAVYGTNVHTAFKAEIRALENPGLTSEVSYMNGMPVDYGTAGSIRVDAVYGQLKQPVS